MISALKALDECARGTVASTSLLAVTKSGGGRRNRARRIPRDTAASIGLDVVMEATGETIVFILRAIVDGVGDGGTRALTV